jgi:hypothetical protein
MILRSVVRCSFGAIFMLSAQLANAQVAGQSGALPPAAIAAFLANPGQVMNQFPNGGPGLAKQVSDLMDSDKATLATLIAFAKTANEDQRKAIAQGLAQAAKAYASGDPAFANQIQQSVANSGLPEFSKAYAEAAGDTGTASTGGGGGGGGGGPNVAGAPTGGQNSGSTTGTGGTNNQATGLLGSSGAGGGGFSQATTNNNNQVSPF